MLDRKDYTTSKGPDETTYGYYTHSEMKADGTVLVYVETPDAEDGFHSLLCVLPKYEIKDVIGYTKDEQEKILARIKKNSHLIIKYSQIGGFQSDAATA